MVLPDYLSTLRTSSISLPLTNQILVLPLLSLFPLMLAQPFIRFSRFLDSNLFLRSNSALGLS